MHKIIEEEIVSGGLPLTEQIQNMNLKLGESRIVPITSADGTLIHEYLIIRYPDGRYVLRPLIKDNLK